ncbi:MAG TPA: FAD:protein FMN transferase [Desulfonatronum sp.]|nr:FAD:protein FMN transferase [Desulfonatronum sp.]
MRFLHPELRGSPPRRLCPAAILLAVLLLPGLQGCRQNEDFLVQGTTMGTVFVVRATGAPAGACSKLKADIDRRLEEINALLSVYLPDSELSRFNALTETGLPFTVSRDFQNVLGASIHVHELTRGAFDPTVKPLLDLWGFGPVRDYSRPWQPPDLKDVQQILQAVGLDRIDFSSSEQLRKTDLRVQLDFGAVAKGYAVDQLAELLRLKGIDNFLVDIGGDLLASGNNRDGQAWRVGLNRPAPDAAWDDVLMVLHPRDTAVVTSGDYRKFFIHAGHTYSHVLDPRTGQPTQNNVASVTVTAQTAAFADALATGLMVLGMPQGMELVEELPEVEALFLLRNTDGTFVSQMSSGFAVAAGLETP